MRGRSILAIVLILGELAFAGAARADDWWLFSRTRTPRTVMFIDLSSIGAADGMPTVWMRRYEDGSPRSRGGRPIYEFAERWQADCDGRRARVTEAQIFSYEGELLGEGAGEGEWLAPELFSNTELLLRVLCANDRRELDDVPAADPVALKAMAITGFASP